MSVHPKPFHARQTGMMMAKDANQWLPIIRQVWRTHELEVVEAWEIEACEKRMQMVKRRKLADEGRHTVRRQAKSYGCEKRASRR
jgi:hypothetical protein